MSIIIASVIGIALLVFTIGLDVYLAADKISGNTFSEMIRVLAQSTPFVPWACGVLCGHWFYPGNHLRPLFGQPNSVVFLLWLTWAVVIVGFAFNRASHPIPTWLPLLPAFFAGWFLWPCNIVGK